MRRIAITALLGLAAVAGAAQAQTTTQQQQTPTDQGASCAAPLPASASLTNVTGPVLVARADGSVTEVVGGSALNLGPGDRILVRDDGGGLLTYGPCAFELTESSTVTLTQVGDTLVAVEELETAVIPLLGAPLLAAAGGVTAAAGAAAAGVAADAGEGDAGIQSTSSPEGTGG